MIQWDFPVLFLFPENTKILQRNNKKRHSSTTVVETIKCFYKYNVKIMFFACTEHMFLAYFPSAHSSNPNRLKTKMQHLLKLKLSFSLLPQRKQKQFTLFRNGTLCTKSSIFHWRITFQCEKCNFFKIFLGVREF